MRGMTLMETLVALAIASICLLFGVQSVRWGAKLTAGVNTRLEAEEQRISLRLGADCAKTMEHAPSPWTANTSVAIYTKKDKVLIATSAGKLRGVAARAKTGSTAGTFVIETKDGTGAWRNLRDDVPFSCL